MKWLLALALCCGGCGTATVQAPPPVHQGAANQFDSQAYDSLVAAQGAIEKARETVATSYPQYRKQMNLVISTYNATMEAYKAYHSAVAAGQPFDVAGLQQQINEVVTSVAVLVAQIGGGQ